MKDLFDKYNVPAPFNDVVLVDKGEYAELRVRDLQLTMLENGGVSNWEWCGDCYGPEYLDHLKKLCDKLEVDADDF